jgi:hypothetical protein
MRPLKSTGDNNRKILSGRIVQFLLSPRGQMTRLRNILICFGLFWLSLWVVGPFSWLFGKLNDRIIYGDSVLEAVAMGIMTSLGRTFVALLAGSVVALTVAGRKPERWAIIVASLYVVDAPVRHHWHLPATNWDRLWQSVDLVFPAIACIAAAFTTAHFQHKGAGGDANETPASRFLSRIKYRPKITPALCVALAFLPGAITVVYICLDIDASHFLLNPIDLAAFVWLGATYLHYRNTRTTGAAWLFALFPVAFVEPALLVSLWISGTYFQK